MKPLRTVAIFALLAPLATGCGRASPFDKLDHAPMTVMRLQGQEAPPQAAPAAQLPQIPGLPIPPELQQMGQQAIQGLQSVLPPGLIPPGLLPGLVPNQQPQNQKRFKNYIVLAEMPLADEDAKDELLDIFGHEANFQAEKGNCFSPGLGITINRPDDKPVDLLISLSCNSAQGDGFKWPHAQNGFTPDSRQRLTKLYEKLWGPAPPGA